jgi:hypothetical protein
MPASREQAVGNSRRLSAWARGRHCRTVRTGLHANLEADSADADSKHPVRRVTASAHADHGALGAADASSNNWLAAFVRRFIDVLLHKCFEFRGGDAERRKLRQGSFEPG